MVASPGLKRSELTTQLYLVPMLRIHRSIPLLSFHFYVHCHHSHIITLEENQELYVPGSGWGVATECAVTAVVVAIQDAVVETATKP